MRPLKRADGNEGLLVCNGDAEVWKGALDLTPLRKGMGLAGAAWFHRPLKVSAGFETEFDFRVTPPVPYLDTSTNQWLYPRAADGFAFVLQLDGHGPHALGSAGVQLGFGGISNCAPPTLVTPLLPRTFECPLADAREIVSARGPWVGEGAREQCGRSGVSSVGAVE